MIRLTASEAHQLHPATAWSLVRAIVRLARLQESARQERLKLEHASK